MSSGSTNGGENNAISSSVNNINEISYNNEKTWEDCYEKDEEIIEMDKQNKVTIMLWENAFRIVKSSVFERFHYC